MILKINDCTLINSEDVYAVFQEGNHYAVLIVHHSGECGDFGKIVVSKETAQLIVNLVAIDEGLDEKLEDTPDTIQ